MVVVAGLVPSSIPELAQNYTGGGNGIGVEDASGKC